MGAFIIVMIIIALCMWAFGRFMYPRPPKGYHLPQAGDVVTPRICNFCGHSLAEYRGIVELNPASEQDWFFCNGEHQAKFHAGETYQPYQEKM